MSIRGLWPCLSLCAAVLCACGGSDDDDSYGGDSASVGSCNAQCEAQETVRTMGCAPFIPLADCKQVCAQLAQNVKGCGDEFNAYYDCSAADGFQCIGTLVANKTHDCDDELAAFNTCQNGSASGGGTCQGANAQGRCPQIECPCPEGVKNGNGQSSKGGNCVCLDATNCKDLLCD